MAAGRSTTSGSPGAFEAASVVASNGSAPAWTDADRCLDLPRFVAAGSVAILSGLMPEPVSWQEWPEWP